MLVMSRALGSAEDVSGAVHLPEAAARLLPHADVGSAVTLLRLEGTPRSVAQRLAMLAKELEASSEALGEIEFDRALAKSAQSLALSRRSRGGDLAAVRAADDWRRCAAGPADRWSAISTTGAAGSSGLPSPPRAMQGPDASGLRSRPAAAMPLLVRAPIAIRAAVDVFQPQEPALAALTRRVKESFDPLGRFNPGRMYPGV